MKEKSSSKRFVLTPGEKALTEMIEERLGETKGKR